MDTFELEMVRRWFTERTTISEVKIAGLHECFILEDRDRPTEEKVPRETAIPAGRYRVTRTMSTRFGVVMPLVWNVKTPDGRLLVQGEGKIFAGIRIHPGNRAADTDGCLLPGRQRGADEVIESRVAFEALDAKIAAMEAAGKEVWLTITRAPDAERLVC